MDYKYEVGDRVICKHLLASRVFAGTIEFREVNTLVLKKWMSIKIIYTLVDINPDSYGVRVYVDQDNVLKKL